MNMIEKVAKALCNRRNTGQCAALCLQHLVTGKLDCPEALIVFGADAKAAIQAMEEPTPIMRCEGAATCPVLDTSVADDCYRAMIRAALSEK